MKYCQPIDLTINHNWEQTIVSAHKLMLLESAASTYKYGNSQHYDLKSLGSISRHSISDSWIRVAGPAINKTMPWIQDLLETLKDLKPDDGAISCMNGAGAEHVDFPHMQTALNYIFKNSDESAYTWVGQGELKETYISRVNTAWLLNTQELHGIQNSGERWTLSIHFNTDYNIVCDWFNNHGGLVFGNKG